MYLFGYTNPDVLSPQQKETPSDRTHMYNCSLVKHMDDFKEIKEMFGGYPRVNIQVIPTEFKDFTINSISANYKPEAGLFSNLYNKLSNDKKTYSYGQQIYITLSYPNHLLILIIFLQYILQK